MIEKQDRTHQTKLTTLRLVLLLMQLAILLNNRNDQTSYIARQFPTTPLNSAEFKQLDKNYQAANTMALVFVAMQLIIVYVGTNRHRLMPTFFVSVLHVLGNIAYVSGSAWHLQNMWVLFHVFSFVPLVSEIAVALYTARS